MTPTLKPCSHKLDYSSLYGNETGIWRRCILCGVEVYDTTPNTPHHMNEPENLDPKIQELVSKNMRKLAWKDDMSQPNTPNEVDELDRITIQLQARTRIAYKSDEPIKRSAEARSTAMQEIRSYIAKQQALYHAAGLRELKQPSASAVTAEGALQTLLDRIDHAIAREESK